MLSLQLRSVVLSIWWLLVLLVRRGGMTERMSAVGRWPWGQPAFTSTGRHKPGLPPRSEVHGRVPLPEGYHSVNPYIVVDDAERLIGFLAEVFGAVEQGRSLRPDGRIDHGDVRIGDSLVMLSEASEKYPARPCVHFVYVPDVDATYRAALAPELPRSWSPPSSPGATVRAASSTRSTTAGGSRPIYVSSPRPTTAEPSRASLQATD
jgi:hypothetical protein